MSTKLDKSRKYGLLQGRNGLHFTQDGKAFGPNGEEKRENADGKWVAVTDDTPAVKKDVKYVEFDMDSIASITDFDLFHAALKEADLKQAKKALKSFALDVVGMDKINTNKGLGKLIDEVQAEYKAVLEMDLD